MSFKIKHENFTNLIVCTVSTLLFFLILFFDFGIILWGSIICWTVTGISAVLFFIEQIVGTAIVIEDRTIIIKYFIGRKKIAVEEICNLDIERYKRYRRGHGAYTEYRLRMTINLLSGKKIVLTDKATGIKGAKGFLFSNYEEIPDEEVSLYKAYLAIRQRCVKHNNWQLNEPTSPDKNQ